MTENKAEIPDPAAPPEELTLTIKFNVKTGKINIDGPIQNEAFCDWLMKKASQQIELYNNQQVTANKIQAAPGSFLNGLRRRM